MTTHPRCWICRNPATTGEHKAKRSDLRDVVSRSVTQKTPLHYRDDKNGQRTISSLNAKLLKFPDKICEHCNTARTQPHDRAWERLSVALRTRITNLAPGACVRTDRIFREDTARQMLNVHLFFIKQFGLMILEGEAKIDVAPFGEAIMKNKAHPAVFLRFDLDQCRGNLLVGRSDLDICTRADGSCVHASWVYNVKGLCVQVTYAENRIRHGCGWWHPSLGTNRLLIGDIAS